MRHGVLRFLAVLLLLSLLVVAGCGANPAPAPAPEKKQEPVTIKMLHWNGADAKAVVDDINARFMKEYPNIKIEWESPPLDQYDNIVKTRIAADDVPDLIGLHPGTPLYGYAKAGHLLDLSDQPWTSDISAGAKKVITYQGKIYALPLDTYVIGAVYNQAIFDKVGVKPPGTWQELIDVSKKLKAAGYIPIALGNKDQWITQLIPYAMAPTMIYAGTPGFDDDMYAGKAKFNGSTWNKMMDMYLHLNKLGLFNDDALAIGYDQTIELMATEKAAMVVNGNWILAPIRKANANLKLSMFALPAVDKAGDPLSLATSVGATTAISAKSKHAAEAKKYLQFLARPDIMGLYLNEKKAFSALKSISVDFDPAVKELGPLLQSGRGYPFLDANWPAGVQDVMLKAIQEVFSGDKTIPQMLDAMDSAWAEKTKK